MPHITHRSRLRLCIFILTVLFALTACIGGGDSATSGPGTVVGIADGGATISGSVIDGPVIAATIVIKDAQGETVATTTSDGNARFTTHIPDQATFPLTITSTGGFNIVTNGPPTFALASTMMKPSDTTANLNPFTTLIVKTAQAMPGGLTPANLSAASEIILEGFNAGLDPSQVPDPITTPLTVHNVATFVRSSEVLAEIIRRNHQALVTANMGISEDAMIHSLAADMSDGVLDGQGASGADSRVSATMLVTSAQVLVEAIRNTLDVNNAPATDMLDVAIGIAAPGSSQKTADLPVTEELLQSTRTALDAAMLVSDNTGLAHTQAALDTVVSGDASMMAASMVPALASNDMDDAINKLIASPANQNKALKGRPDFEAPDGNESSDETSEATKLAVISAHASSHDEARGRVPGNVIDDDLTSRWTVLSMPQWIVLDLGATQQISQARLLMFGENFGRDFSYVVETSLDNANWTTAANSAEVAASPLWTETSFSPVHGRYVRISLESSTATDYANVYEIEILGEQLTVPGDTDAPVTDPGNEDTAPVDEGHPPVAGDPGTDDGSDDTGSGSDAPAVDEEVTAPAEDVLPGDEDADLPVEISNTTLTLTWEPNAGELEGYIVYFGPSASAVTEETSDIKAFAGSFDPEAPLVRYDSWFDLGLEPGDQACFKLRAYNADGISDWSAPACSVIPHST